MPFGPGTEMDAEVLAVENGNFFGHFGSGSHPLR